MEKLGFDKEDVQMLNPSIIYCSISGYGQNGPYSSLPGHDLNYLAVSGISEVSAVILKGAPEATGGIQIADLASSLYATVSILAALLQRTKRQESVYIDVSMAESALALMVPRIAEYYGRNKPVKDDFMGRGAYGAFKTKDNKYISIACVEEKFWSKFCETVGMKEFLLDSMFNSWTKRMESSEIINNRIENIIKQKTLIEWMAIFTKEDLPVSPVNSIDDLVDDPHLKYRNSITKKDENLIVSFPAKFENMETKKDFNVPKLGQHNYIFK